MEMCPGLSASSGASGMRMSEVTLVNEPLTLLTWIRTDVLGQPVLVETGRVDCDLVGPLRSCIHPTQA